MANIATSYNNTTPYIIPVSGTTASTSPYTNQYSSNSAIGKMIAAITQYLQPQDAFSDTVDQATVMAPYLEQAKQFAATTLLPQYQYYTVNPFENATANTAAVSNTNLMGRGENDYARKLNEVLQPYYENLANVNQQFSNVGSSDYVSQAGNYYNAPNANLNI